MPTKFLSTSLLGEQPTDVAQLQHLVARRVDEIAVTVVDDDEVTLGIEARAPQLSRRLVVGVARKTLIGGVATARLADKRGSHRDLRFGPADDVALRSRDFDACEARFVGRAERHDLCVSRVERSLAFEDPPDVGQILFHRSSRSITRDRAYRARAADFNDA